MDEHKKNVLLHDKAVENIRHLGRIVLTLCLGFSLYVFITRLGILPGLIIGIVVGTIGGIVIAGILGRVIFPDVKLPI